MSINTDTSTITLVAWWGAILSTIIFCWDVYKWRTSGPKIRLSVSSGMESINMPLYEGKTLILVNVTNYGDRPTTITHLALKFFPNWISRLRKKASKAFIVPQPSPAQQLPYELKQGTVWSGIAEQSADIEAMAKTGHLICELYHSHRDKPESKRINIRHP
ncbi:MAG: hypothetical protein IPK44_04630 [Candidatus Accumulibacter sp.]|uniref:hypothetical protein n=1 Tax=Accumulibacter sp. TaxID=2053492 RepID=UPI00258E074E|nr:hypothetical protein [Accumulibacter sp.]MBK8113873.1 hypothetical protein [Accumulibacter sp.]